MVRRTSWPTPARAPSSTSLPPWRGRWASHTAASGSRTEPQTLSGRACAAWRPWARPPRVSRLFGRRRGTEPPRRLRPARAPARRHTPPPRRGGHRAPAGPVGLHGLAPAGGRPHAETAPPRRCPPRRRVAGSAHVRPRAEAQGGAGVGSAPGRPRVRHGRRGRPPAAGRSGRARHRAPAAPRVGRRAGPGPARVPGGTAPLRVAPPAGPMG